MGEWMIGVMSGTSLDGSDVALCRIDSERCELSETLHVPYASGLKARLLQIMEGVTTLAEMTEIDHVLGLHYAAAINALIARAAIHRDQISAIGLHGQTLWHAPKTPYPSTLQCGDPALVAVRTGIRTIADFRRKDMALGGQGAPLAPAFHRYHFGKHNLSMAVVNIGGIANLSVLTEPITGYDTGPGNLLMDGWIARVQGKPYDAAGEWARSGRVDEALLERFLGDAYFALPAPKSTGREVFDLAWIDAHCAALSHEIAAVDVQRTLLELTARTIADAVGRAAIDRLVLCGGGAENQLLVERLGDMLPSVRLEIAEEGPWIEAMMMAWLAYLRIHRHAVALSGVTGARHDAILGGVHEAD
jgi:anhydro-N-acetylmuramic acid kinase